jgi:hypothetical protein
MVIPAGRRTPATVRENPAERRQGTRESRQKTDCEPSTPVFHKCAKAAAIKSGTPASNALSVLHAMHDQMTICPPPISHASALAERGPTHATTCFSNPHAITFWVPVHHGQQPYRYDDACCRRPLPVQPSHTPSPTFAHYQSNLRALPVQPSRTTSPTFAHCQSNLRVLPSPTLLVWPNCLEAAYVCAQVGVLPLMKRPMPIPTRCCAKLSNCCISNQMAYRFRLCLKRGLLFDICYLLQNGGRLCTYKC